MDPAAAEKYVFKRIPWRLPEVLQELYSVAANEGKITTLKEAKKLLTEQERVDAPQVAAERWRASWPGDPPAGLAGLPRTLHRVPPDGGGLERG